PVEKPTARTMTAMIRWWERRLLGVFSLEHSRRMRDANEKHRVLACLGRSGVNGVSGMLLEHVVDVLHTRDVSFANAIRSLVEPANRRPERNSVITNFSFGL